MATLDDEGRITIPAKVREAMRIAGGDRVEFVETGPGRFEIVAASGTVRALKGLFGPARRVSLAEMDDAVASGASSPE